MPRSNLRSNILSGLSEKPAFRLEPSLYCFEYSETDELALVQQAFTLP